MQSAASSLSPPSPISPSAPPCLTRHGGASNLAPALVLTNPADPPILDEMILDPIQTEHYILSYLIMYSILPRNR